MNSTREAATTWDDGPYCRKKMVSMTKPHLRSITTLSWNHDLSETAKVGLCEKVCVCACVCVRERERLGRVTKEPTNM